MSQLGENRNEKIFRTLDGRELGWKDEGRLCHRAEMSFQPEEMKSL